MRRPLYLAIVGVSIVVSAVSVGTALTRYLSLRTYSPKAPPGIAVAAVEPASAPPVEEWKNPFSPAQGMKIPSRLPAASKGGGAAVSRTNFILVGTIASSTPSARRAILWADGMKEPRAYRESEEVEPGAVLASVERDKVWLLRGSEREKLELLPVGSKARPTAPPAAPRPAGGTAPSFSTAPSSGGASPGLEGAGAEGEGSRSVTGRIRRPDPSPPPAVGASPGMGQAGDGEERRRRAPERRRPGLVSPPPGSGLPTL